MFLACVWADVGRKLQGPPPPKRTGKPEAVQHVSLPDLACRFSRAFLESFKTFVGSVWTKLADMA